MVFQGRLRLWPLLAVWALGTSCQLEKLFPKDVGMGLGRLTIRSAALLTSIISSDDRCGFKSPQVLQGALVQGQPGQPGAVTWTVQDCELDFGKEPQKLHSNCIGNETFFSGKLRFSATRRVVGTLTGNPQSPIIPAGADSAFLKVHFEFDDLLITRSLSKSSLRNVSGTLDFDAVPFLALSRDEAVCSIPALDMAFSNVRYGDAKAIIDDEGHVFSVDAPRSDFSAQMGKWRDAENTIEGSITVWDSQVSLPIEGDEDGLDPEYTPEDYLATVACDPELAMPVRYQCPSLKEQLVHGAARLSVNLFGNLVSYVDGETRCGFSSPAVTSGAVLSGTTGGRGTVKYTLTQPCTLSFPTRTSLFKDCNGVDTFAEGSVMVTGTKIVSGILTGNPTNPVVPDSRDPAELTLVASFSEFVMSDSASSNALMARSGTLSGTLLPRVALDAESAICSNTTSIAEFRGLEWKDAKLLLQTGGYAFEVDASLTSLDAQTASKGDRTNYLAGLFISDGVPVAVPPAGAAPVLDPDYEPERFMSRFSCAPHFQLAQSEEDCSVDRAFATNAARLLVQNVGTLASMINSDDACGFEDLAVKLSPTRVEGEPGQIGLMAWKVSNCTMGQPGISPRGQDCDGVKSYVSGVVQATVERVVKGERTTEYGVADSIIPKTPDAVTLTLTSVVPTDFSAYSVEPAATQPFARLVLHSGQLSATVAPALGENKSTPGVYDIGTPVASFPAVHLTGAYATLEVAGMQFTLLIDEASLSAQSGSYLGTSNTLSGTVLLGSGKTITLSQVPLDPSFDQAAFDQSYACTKDLKATIPPN